jgi:3-oxoacyl-[acyl-carrier-protein] synthase II
MIEKGGMKVSPFFMPMILPNMAASNVSRILGLKGYNSTVVTACSASNQAMGEALEVLRRGVADVMITGGTEAGISHLGLSGFCSMRALTTNNGNPEEASRPFDAKRDGFVPAEGAAILVLETEKHAIDRGARILCELAGFGSTSDAFHPVHPEDSGDGAMRAMEQALGDAGITVDDVDYINAHGTSTQINDAVETIAIKRLFANRAYNIPVSSTKSMIGHALGASGALEAIPCIYSIVENIVHPTINYQFVDPKCDLDYVPNHAREMNVEVVLSNSFGFGGQNACIVFKRYR